MQDSLKGTPKEKSETSESLKSEMAKRRGRIDAAIGAARDKDGRFDKELADKLLREAQLIPEGVPIMPKAKEEESEDEAYLRCILGITFSDVIQFDLYTVDIIFIKRVTKKIRSYAELHLRASEHTFVRTYLISNWWTHWGYCTSSSSFKIRASSLKGCTGLHSRTCHNCSILGTNPTTSVNSSPQQHARLTKGDS